MSAPKVLICSAAMLTSDGLVANVGDEALTDCLASGIRSLGFRVRATLSSPRNGVTPAPDRVNVHPVFSFAAAIRQADVVVLGGGTLLQENRSEDRHELLAGLLRYSLFVVVLGRIWGKPVHIVAVGAEKLVTRLGRFTTRVLCRLASSVSTRDADSASLLEAISGISPAVVADPMFLLSPPRRDNASRESIFVNLQPGAPDRLVADLARSLNQPALADLEVVLVAMDRRQDGDRVPLAALAEELGDFRTRMFDPTTAWPDLLAHLCGARLAIGMRLHFLIFGVLAGAAPVVISASPKTAAFASELALVCVPSEADRRQLEKAILDARPADEDDLLALHVRARAGLTSIEAARI